MPEGPQLDRHIDAARRRLAHLGGLAGKTDAAERRILAAAQERLAIVQADLAKLKVRAIADNAAGEQYTSLIQEAGQLRLVIAGAERALAA